MYVFISFILLLSLRYIGVEAQPRSLNVSVQSNGDHLANSHASMTRLFLKRDAKPMDGGSSSEYPNGSGLITNDTSTHMVDFGGTGQPAVVSSTTANLRILGLSGGTVVFWLGRQRNLFGGFVTGAMIISWETAAATIRLGVEQANQQGFVTSILVFVPRDYEWYGRALWVLARLGLSNLAMDPTIRVRQYDFSPEPEDPNYRRVWTVVANQYSQQVDISEITDVPTRGLHKRQHTSRSLVIRETATDSGVAAPTSFSPATTAPVPVSNETGAPQEDLDNFPAVVTHNFNVTSGNPMPPAVVEMDSEDGFATSHMTVKLKGLHDHIAVFFYGQGPNNDRYITGVRFQITQAGGALFTNACAEATSHGTISSITCILPSHAVSSSYIELLLNTIRRLVPSFQMMRFKRYDPYFDEDIMVVYEFIGWVGEDDVTTSRSRVSSPFAYDREK